MNATIAEMSMADYDEVAALWQATDGVYFGHGDGPEDIAAYLRRSPGLSFVARENGALVGAVLCGHDGRRGYLHHLAVAAGHRGRGLGAALAEKCLAALGAMGIARCHAFVFADNEAGQEFWRAIGWTGRVELKLVSKDTNPGGAG